MARAPVYDYADIRARFAQGESGAELARATGAHHRTIMRIVQGVTRTPEAQARALLRTHRQRRALGRLYALTDQDRANLLRERREGASYNALGRRYGYDSTAIRAAVFILDPQLGKETARC